MIEVPDKRLKDECIQFWLHRMGYIISPPYAQWDYWHIIKKSGGIVPLNVDRLIEEYLSNPLSQDEIATNHRKNVYQKLETGDRL